MNIRKPQREINDIKESSSSHIFRSKYMLHRLTSNIVKTKNNVNLDIIPLSFSDAFS